MALHHARPLGKEGDRSAGLQICQPYLVAHDWLADAGDDVRLLFCRFTQLGLLRLLSAEAIMGDEVMNQRDAWGAYDRWLEDERVELLDDPPGLERRFRSMTRLRHPAPKNWADSYLAAFAGWRSLRS